MSTLFISHSSSDAEAAKDLGSRLQAPPRYHESLFLDLDPSRGIVAGQSWERTLYRKLRACRAVIALVSDSYLASKWCFAELALARMEGKAVIALKIDPLSDEATLPSILTESQYIDLRHDAAEGYSRLWRGLEELELLGVRGEWKAKDGAPYRGLSAFQEKHAPIFFGRESETRAGLELLERGAPGLIMVLGSSGSGKSSLVRAGMVPRLRREPERWLVVDPFRPRRDPYHELAHALAAAFDELERGRTRASTTTERIRRRLEAWRPEPREPREATEEPPAEGLEAPSSASSASSPPPPPPPPPHGDERLRRLLSELEELRRQPPRDAGDEIADFLDWSLEDLRRICDPSLAPRAAAGPSGDSPLVELAEDLRRAAGRPEARVLLIVDQFEELLADEPAETDETGERTPGPHGADRFLRLLRAAVEAENSPVMVLGTMRSDFLSRFQRVAAIRGIDFASLSVGPMKVDGLRRVIEEPARLGTIGLDPGLADRLLEDVEKPDALPLLSFTLWTLWKRAREQKADSLSIDAYEKLGGLEGAVSGEAQAVLEIARRQGREAEVRRAFVEMARAEGDNYVSRPVGRDHESIRPVWPLLEKFVDRRLLFTGEGQGEPTVEVAHEALFRAWEPLKGWLADAQSDKLLEASLERDAESWLREGRSEDLLWRGGRLQRAGEVLAKRRLSVPGDKAQRDFVRAGKRKRLKRRALGAVIAAAVFVGLAWGLLAAKRQARIATSLRLAAEAQQSDERSLGLLLASEAVDRNESAGTNFSLLDALGREPRLMTQLNDRQERVFGLAWGPDGERLVASGDDAFLVLWDAKQRKVLRRFGDVPAPDANGEDRPEEPSIWAVDMHPSGRWLATGDNDGAVLLWDLDDSDSGPYPVVGYGKGMKVFRLAFSPDGTLLAAGSREGLGVWRFDQGRLDPLEIWGPEGELAEPGGEVWGLAFNRDGLLVTGGAPPGDYDPLVWYAAHEKPGTLGLWDPRGARVDRLWEIKESDRLTKVVNDVAFHPDGNLIASAGKDGGIALWDRATGVAVGGVGGEGDALDPAASDLTDCGPDGHESVWSVAFGPDGRLASGGESDGCILLWDVEAEGSGGGFRMSTADRPMRVSPRSLWTIEFHPSGRILAGVGEIGSIALWNVVSDPPPVSAVTAVTECEASAAFSPDGGRLVLAVGDGPIERFRVASPPGPGPADDPLSLRLEKPARTPEETPGPADGAAACGLALGPGGVIAARRGASSSVMLWEPSGDPRTLGLPDEELKILALAVSPDGRRIAAGGRDPSDVRFFDMASGEMEALRLRGREANWVRALAFAPRGDRLASGDRLGNVTLWDLESGKTRGESMKAHSDSPCLALAFAPGGDRLAAGHADGTIALWDLDERALVGRLSTGQAVLALGFANEGRELLSAGVADGSLARWDVDPASWRDKACEKAGRNLTPSEWELYRHGRYRPTCPRYEPETS